MRQTAVRGFCLLAAATLAASGPALAAPASFEGASTAVPAFTGDAPQEPCPFDGIGDVAPTALAVQPVTDDGAKLELSVWLLIDGMPRRDVDRIVSGAVRAYQAIGVSLRIQRQGWRLAADGRDADGQPTVEGFAAIKRARDLRAPAGTDIVHVLTAKDVYVRSTKRDSSDSLAGVAACVGGISSEGQEFSISEGAFRFARPGAPDDVEAIAMAHEIGHLVGASHHFGNCAESRSKVPGGSGSCTIMWPIAVLNAAVFGSVERAVIRGYVREYG